MSSRGIYTVSELGHRHVTSRKTSSDRTVNQAMTGVTSFSLEVPVPVGAANLDVGLRFPADVDEAIWLEIFTEQALEVELQDSLDNVSVFVFKGRTSMWMATGGGVKRVRVSRLPGAVEEAAISVSYACLAYPDDQPEYS